MNKKKYKRKKSNKKYVEWIEREEVKVTTSKSESSKMMGEKSNLKEESFDSFAPLETTYKEETIEKINTSIASLEEMTEKKEEVEKEIPKKKKAGKIVFWSVLVAVDLLILLLFINVFNGWKHNKDYTGYYYYKFGNPVSGFCTIDKKEYYFDETNTMTEGWVISKDHYYYQTKADGLYKGEKEIDGQIYNFCSDGHLLRGIELIDGSYYLYDEYGYIVSGLYTIDNKTYLGLEDGRVAGGFREYEGNRYYFDPKDGHMITGSQTIEGEKYLFGDDGVMQTGFIEYEGAIHFFSVNTGRMLYDTTMYYMGNNYRLNPDGSIVTGFYEEDGETYYYRADGTMLTEWMTLADGYQYYNKKGQRVYGWQDIEEERYYFDEETGYMFNGGWLTIDDKDYYFKEDGKAAKGFTFIDDKCYYFNIENAWFKKTGFGLVEGKKYYFQEDCSIVFGWQTIDGNKYYFDSVGVMSTGLRTIGGNQYYFYNDGKMAVSTKIGKWVVDENGIVSDPFKTITPENLDMYIEQLLNTKGRDLNSIYLYCKSFRYKYKNKSDVNTMACRMLNTGCGACWDYAALCYKMMTAAGYNCKIVIGKGAVYSEHNWILVEISPGVWRHVDPERQGYNIFLLTDAELEAYDGIKSNVRYQWDHSAYPAAN